MACGFHASVYYTGNEVHQLRRILGAYLNRGNSIVCGFLKWWASPITCHFSLDTIDKLQLNHEKYKT